MEPARGSVISLVVSSGGGQAAYFLQLRTSADAGAKRRVDCACLSSWILGRSGIERVTEDEEMRFGGVRTFCYVGDYFFPNAGLLCLSVSFGRMILEVLVCHLIEKMYTL